MRRPTRRSWIVAATALVVLFGGRAQGAARQAAPIAPAHEPLPIEVAVSLRGHDGRSPINLSPDGEWVAHTVESADSVPRGATPTYADTGFPFAEGNARMEATISNLRTGEQVLLGTPDSASWGAAWSPDGTRVAFYSDAGGEAGLWVWDRDTRRARRIPGIVARPFFGFEMPRWSPDGSRLLVKALPADMTVAEANALFPAAGGEPEETVVDPSTPTVTVRRSTAAQAEMAPTDEPSQPGAGGDVAERYLAAYSAVELALVDLDDDRIERLTSGVAVRLYAFSPDGGEIAYSVQTGREPSTQQPLYALHVIDGATGEDRTPVDSTRLGYGIEWSWSPDGRSLAYTSSGQLGDGKVTVVSVADGTARLLDNDAPPFAPGEGEVPPIWSADGARIYGIAAGALWAVDVADGSAREVAHLDEGRMRCLMTPSYGEPVAWSTDGGATLWVTATREGGLGAAVYAVDVAAGTVRPLLREDRSYAPVFSLAAATATGEIVFLARDQQHPGELYALDTATERVRQVSHINAAMERYALGEARLIHWRSTDGQPLAGALLLPPGYTGETRLPLVVFVYGGANGSESINRFGLWGATPAFDMHVLATRGYAVLYPDAPVRTGRVTEDLVGTVLPGVNAAVEQGYADPERLAVMGQSYGSLNTLALLTRTDRFKAAIITAAVLHPDLFADYLGDTGYYEKGQGNMGGTIWEQHDRYLENSPLFEFPRIDTPVLIGQGDKDGDLVPSEAIFTALDRLGKSVEYRVYGGESHVISGRANVVDFWERRLEFLARHLDLETGPDGVVHAR